MDLVILKLVDKVLRPLENAVIMELGASNGSDTDWLIRAPKSVETYVAVEPDHRVVPALLRRHTQPSFRVCSAAISDHTGLSSFYLSYNEVGILPQSSSIRKPTGHLDLWPWCKFLPAVTIPCVTLDDLAQEHGLIHVDFIWADLQGAEVDMVKGGSKTLAMTDWLLVESYCQEVYEGAPPRAEFLEMLPDFELVESDVEKVLLRRRRP